VARGGRHRLQLGQLRGSISFLHDVQVGVVPLPLSMFALLMTLQFVSLAENAGDLRGIALNKPWLEANKECNEKSLMASGCVWAPCNNL
jgi:hypothetical protein